MMGATGAQRGRTKVTNKQINNTTLLGAREFELYEAANNEDPRLALNLSEPLNWLSNGCDFDLDIIPGIKHMATKNKVTNWSYCRGRVFQNRDTRLAPAPKPIVNGTGNRNFSTKADRNKEAVAKAREWFNEMQGNPHQSEMKAIN
ncbi:MAG: hypothetical protein GY749_22860 [Desulfobacteraceae bacterium]|nr:hypothetical protein [Desulfobacteraceae bacterium]